MCKKVRVRFAPSPTGYVHVGSLRTALYNYLYAKKKNGDCILRIEDTDRTRYVEGAVENVLKSMEESGINFDEGPDRGGDYGPYYQSERTELYRKFALELIEKGHAYYCFCSAEDLDKMREEQKARGEFAHYDGRCRCLSEETVKEKLSVGEPHVIRLKVPDEGEISFTDIIREKVTFPWSQIDDQVLIKSDGFPTYHLANVIDDHSMKITHVIRGEEWLSSTPKHLLLYQAFGWDAPQTAHLPLLLNPDKSKLSKRQGDVAVEDYMSKGYLPHALVNFVALLGWHTADNREIFSMEELEREFSLERISKSGAVFDVEKLKWMNAQYINSMSSQELLPFVKKFTDFDFDDEKFLNLIELLKERAVLLTDFDDLFKQLDKFPEKNEENTELILNSKKLYEFWADEIENAEEKDEALFKRLLKKSQKKLGFKGKNLYMPLRIALFGQPHGPEIPDLIKCRGIEETIKRFRELATWSD